MRFLDQIRDPKPRLKPGFTYFRLLVFLVVVAGLAVAAEHFASGTYPPRGECEVKGIDSYHRNEGSCTEEGRTLVVVDRHSTLKLRSLEARLLRIRERKVGGGHGRAGERGRFVTFDLSVTNLTARPARVRRGQFVLLAGKPFSEVGRAVERLEPRSFLNRRREIPPHGSESGTVSFRESSEVAGKVPTEGNLDVVNFGVSVPRREPRAVFSEPEHGVFRTYQ